MANFIWTAILYFSTSTIVYITYRTFMNDRKAEAERRTSDIVFKAKALKQEHADIDAPRPIGRRREVTATAGRG